MKTLTIWRSSFGKIPQIQIVKYLKGNGRNINWTWYVNNRNCNFCGYRKISLRHNSVNHMCRHASTHKILTSLKNWILTKWRYKFLSPFFPWWFNYYKLSKPYYYIKSSFVLVWDKYSNFTSFLSRDALYLADFYKVVYFFFSIRYWQFLPSRKLFFLEKVFH